MSMNYSLGILNYRRYLPVTFQFSVLLTLPWLVYLTGYQALWVIPVAWLWHWLIFVVTGHMIISHSRTSWIPHGILYGLFFYSTYITPFFWGALHIQHHKHRDTELDPHSPDYLGFWQTLIALYDPGLTDKRTMVKHLRYNQLSQFFVKYYSVLLLIPVTAFFVIPTDIFLMFYAVPASLSFTIATFSTYYTHHNHKPRSDFDTWAKVLFLGESEHHDRHHNDWSYCAPVTELCLKSH